MIVSKIYANNKTTLSFEYYPPRTPESAESTYQEIQKLSDLHPSYVSVTYGAGGTTRTLTTELVKKLHTTTHTPVVPHLTCVGHTQDELREILEEYDKLGISNIMALRGDPPKGQEHFTPIKNGLNYASELVAFIKKHFPHFGVGVAGYPEGHHETPNRLKEMEHLKAKADAGADYICTQLFFDNHDFYDFRERCEISGINIPIAAGIMPISSRANMNRMGQLALGSRFPAPLLKAVTRADDEGIDRVGIHWASEQVRDLLDNHVQGIHFYTLNKSQGVLEICQNLGISDARILNSKEKLLFI